MGLSMLAGKSWEKLAKSIPGYKPFRYDKFLYCGLRDICDESRQTVADSWAEVIWGDANEKVEFASQLRKHLKAKDYSPALVHLDLDALDISVGIVNKFSAHGGLLEDDLEKCFKMIPSKTKPVSLTIASFDPSQDVQGTIEPVAIKGVVAFVQGLISQGFLKKTLD